MNFHCAPTPPQLSQRHHIRLWSQPHSQSFLFLFLLKTNKQKTPFKITFCQAQWHSPLIPGLGGQKLGELCEFEASQGLYSETQSQFFSKLHLRNLFWLGLQVLTTTHLCGAGNGAQAFLTASPVGCVVHVPCYHTELKAQVCEADPLFQPLRGF